MEIPGIGSVRYPVLFGAKGKEDKKSEKGFGAIWPEETKDDEPCGGLPQKSEGAEEVQTKTNIIVRPDGSRVLVVSTRIGGMQTNMSLKISEATDMPNEAGCIELGADNMADTTDEG